MVKKVECVKRSFLIALLLFFLPIYCWADRLQVTTGGWLVIDKDLLQRMASPSAKTSNHPLENLGNAIEDISLEFGVSPGLVKSIIWSESSGNPKAVSRKGAMGLMQLMPETAKEYKVVDPFDPLTNIRAGVQYIKDLLKEFSGNLSLALAAYNAGPHAVRKYQGIPPYNETQEFVRKVNNIYRANTSTPIFSSPPKEKRIIPLVNPQKKIYIKSSPRDLAVFLKNIR